MKSIKITYTQMNGKPTTDVFANVAEFNNAFKAAEAVEENTRIYTPTDSGLCRRNNLKAIEAYTLWEWSH